MNIIGGVLVAVVLVLLLATLVTTLRRNAHEHQRRRLELELFHQRIAAAKALRAGREQAHLSWSGYRKFVISGKVAEAEGIASFYLMPHDRRPLPLYKPGQYLTFKVNVPGQDKSVIRCYSLSDAPKADCYRVTIKRVPGEPAGLVSNFFHDHLDRGDILDIEAPRGHFYLELESTRPVVLIGGGVGITPVLSMLNAIVNEGSIRETWFFYGGRNSRDHAMRAHLDELAAAHENIHLHVCYSAPLDSDRASPRPGYHMNQRVTVEFLKQRLPSNNYLFYICGPPGMMSSMISELKEWGVPKDQILTEAFGAQTVGKTAQTVEKKGKAKRSSTVTFGRSKKSCPWKEEVGNLLDLALALDVQIESGCRAGSCQTCRVAVKEGKVQYVTEFEPDTEEGTCLTCIAAPDGDLVLDA